MYNYTSLLFLLPPSCMVAPIGKFANKFSFSTHFSKLNTASNSTTEPNFKNLLPAMPSEISIGMDNQSGRVLTNNNEVRGRSSLPSIHSSREPSMVSSGRSTPYHDRMDMDLDNAPVAGIMENISPELSYEMEQEKALRIGKAANTLNNTRSPDVSNEATPPNGLHEDDIINVQLPYDLQAPTEPKLWSGSFHLSYASPPVWKTTSPW